MTMSSAGSPRTPATPAEAAKTVRQEARFGASFLRVHRWRLFLVFIGVLLPLWGFGTLVEELREGEGFAFDEPLLRLAHAMASAGFDRAFLLMSALGYGWGVIPVDIGLVLGLALRRRFREGLFAAISMIGSLLLNLAAKHSFARARPDLWPSIAPETTYSFPSGHAMGSMTLAWVVVLLCWHPRLPGGLRLRWPATLLAAGFVVLVGLSRVYLGVHYPSDILAGWTAASVWVCSVYALVFRSGRHPWQVRAARVP
jgi:membrane-associated phospholipid phosphatase